MGGTAKRYEKLYPRQATREQKTEFFLALLEHLEAELRKQNAKKVISINRGRGCQQK